MPQLPARLEIKVGIAASKIRMMAAFGYDFAGDLATEELIRLASELGMQTGIDLDRLVDVGYLAESLVGHRLPSATLHGGRLSSYRVRVSG